MISTVSDLWTESDIAIFSVRKLNSGNALHLAWNHTTTRLPQRWGHSQFLRSQVKVLPFNWQIQISFKTEKIIYLCQNATVKGCKKKNTNQTSAQVFTVLDRSSISDGPDWGCRKVGSQRPRDVRGPQGLTRLLYFKGWWTEKAVEVEAISIHLLSIWKTFKGWMIFSPSRFGN